MSSEEPLIPSDASEDIDLDRVDFRILSLLEQNGRASFASIGEHVGLSSHGAANRVRRLIAAGVIKGFSANVDYRRVGRGLDAFIDVRLMPSTQPEEFERRVGALPTVREIVFVTGRFDYQVRVACQGADDLNQTVRSIRQGAGAAATETRITMRSATFHPKVDAPADRDAR